MSPGAETIVPESASVGLEMPTKTHTFLPLCRKTQFHSTFSKKPSVGGENSLVLHTLATKRIPEKHDYTAMSSGSAKKVHSGLVAMAEIKFRLETTPTTPVVYVLL